MAKIDKKDFFKRTVDKDAASAPAPSAEAKQPEADAHVREKEEEKKNTTPATEAPHKSVSIPRKIQLSMPLLQSVKDACLQLEQIGFKGLANDMAALYRMAVNKRFTVAFVGEFNRGKSTLINRLIGNDILPVGILPTTAILTRIVYGKEPALTVCQRDGKRERLPLEKKSWEGLTAAHFGEKEPEGSVIVEYPDKWLGEYAIDILDTPGAGDLEEKRAKVIERAMVGADAAIIAVDATRPLSMTEQLFIKQKVMSRGVPFVALGVTKLDLVKPEDRPEVLKYIHGRLKKLKISMPVLIADDKAGIIDTDTLREQRIFVGMNALKNIIVAWMANEKRRELMEKWLTVNALSIINSANAFLLQQKEIVDAKDAEKERLIAKRSAALAQMHSQWETLRSGMKSRCEKCIEAFRQAAESAGESMIENLQHTTYNYPNPKEWLEKEYAYRVKRELSAISLSLDNLVAKYVTTDLRWLNTEMNKQFKEMVGSEVVGLMSKEYFTPSVDDRQVKFKDLKDKSLKNTIISSALTLGAATLLGMTGGAPLIFATMGVGTVTNLYSRYSLDKEGAKQREILQDIIRQQVPTIIAEASADSATKIRIIYNDLITESHKTESRWMEAQRALIRSSVESEGKAPAQQLDMKLKTVEQLIEKFS